jgi:hypothetical protein
MPRGRDVLAARFTRALSSNADAPTIAIYFKLRRKHCRAYRTTFLRGHTIFFVGPARNDL